MKKGKHVASGSWQLARGKWPVAVHPYAPFLFSAFCLILSCSQNKNENSLTSESPKFTQYYNQGKELYEKNCSNCHQKNGTGLGRLYPPVSKSDFVDNNRDAVLCVMRYGKSGELVVNGIQFNQPMKGVASLTDLEIAEIATYIYNTWGRSRGIVESTEAAKVLQHCSTTN